MPRRILVRLPNWVGDVVMATPALAALRAAHPQAEIVVEGRAFLRGLLAGLPTIDDFLPDAGKGLAATRRRVRDLRARRFDWAVLLPDSVRAAVAPFLARVPYRVGYARDVLRRLLVTEVPPLPAEGGRRAPIPMVERYLRITRAAGCPDAETSTQLVIDEDLERRVDELLTAAGVMRGRGILLVTPGANFGTSKLYPPESFAAASDGIAAATGLAVVLAPAPAEVELATRIVGLMAQPAVAICKESATLEVLKGLVARASLLLSNDTGPRHVAVALGRPVVCVMGPTDPRHTAYQLERQRVLREDVDCSPCQKKICPIDHRCMTRLAPQRVIDAALELLAGV